MTKESGSGSGSTGWRKYKEKIEHNEKFITSVSTIFIAAFTVLLAFATFFLWSATRDLVEDAKHSGEVNSSNMQAAIAESRRSADAAKKSAEVSEKTLNLTQRAFVFIKLDGQPMVDPDHQALVGFSFHPAAENFGNTPANNWESYFGGEMFDGEIPDGFDYPPADRGGPLRGSIPPRSKMNAGRGTMGRNIVELIHKKQKRFFIWGRAKYNDIFEGTPTYNIEYCWEVEFSGTTDDPTKIQIFFKQYSRHNREYETPRH